MTTTHVPSAISSAADRAYWISIDSAFLAFPVVSPMTMAVVPVKAILPPERVRLAPVIPTVVPIVTVPPSGLRARIR